MPTLRVWARRRCVLRVSIAKTAYPAHRIQALSKRCEPAIRAAGAVGAVVRAPRIVLGLGTLSGAYEALGAGGGTYCVFMVQNAPRPLVRCHALRKTDEAAIR